MNTEQLKSLITRHKKTAFDLFCFAAFIAGCFAAYILIFGQVHGRSWVYFAFDWVKQNATENNPFKKVNFGVEFTCTIPTKTPQYDCKNETQIAKVKAEEELAALNKEVESQKQLEKLIAVSLFSKAYNEMKKEGKHVTEQNLYNVINYTIAELEKEEKELNKEADKKTKIETIIKARKKRAELQEKISLLEDKILKENSAQKQKKQMFDDETESILKEVRDPEFEKRLEKYL